ncbi:MAG: RNA polymerase sigma factor [Nannocystaceae bacterium]|nr:RNA polymerase sigma factor [Nannocystaceae bacterium]
MNSDRNRGVDPVSTLIETHRGALQRYARRVCPSGADAEDAAQATFEKLVASPGTVRDPARTRQWLFTVARHHCLRLIRRAWRWRGTADSTRAGVLEPDQVAAVGAVDMEEAELVRRLLHAIAELEPSQREVLIRRDILGESGDSVAAALELSIPAMKSRLHRARRALAHLGA